MPSFLVELYLPRSTAEDPRTAGERARAAAAELSAEGVPVHYVRTTYLPEDETCFHVFVAETAEAVDEVCRRAALVYPRVTLAVEASGAAPESNRPSRGLHDLTGFEDRLGHRARPLRRRC